MNLHFVLSWSRKFAKSLFGYHLIDIDSIDGEGFINDKLISNSRIDSRKVGHCMVNSEKLEFRLLNLGTLTKVVDCINCILEK